MCILLSKRVQNSTKSNNGELLLTHVTTDTANRRPRKSWKDKIKEWTAQSMSSLLRVAEDRRRWVAITAEASVGTPQRRLDVTSFDWFIDRIASSQQLKAWRRRKWNRPEWKLRANHLSYFRMFCQHFERIRYVAYQQIFVISPFTGMGASIMSWKTQTVDYKSDRAISMSATDSNF